MNYTDEWETPCELFNALDREFKFTLDPCATKNNAKCKAFFTKEDDGLTKDWSGHVVFCNPPYKYKLLAQWMRKCYEESLKGVTVVALIPVRSWLDWWHDYVVDKADLRFIKGKVEFTINGKNMGKPYFGSALAIYDGERKAKEDYEEWIETR